MVGVGPRVKARVAVAVHVAVGVAAAVAVGARVMVGVAVGQTNVRYHMADGGPQAQGSAQAYTLQ